MSNIPEGATHQWIPDDGPLEIACVFGTMNRLSFYKRCGKYDQWWEVYSPITGWRLSMNNQEWFDRETKEGYFKEINV